MKLMKSLIAIALLVVAPIAFSEPLLVAQIDEIQAEQRTMIIGDVVYSYTPFLQVQEYDGDAAQRLPLSKLKVGDWVVVKVEYLPNDNRRKLVRLLLLSSEQQARQLIEQQF